MDQFVKLLYDRLADKKELQLQLYLIMQNAINEMHNNGIFAALSGDAAKAIHNPDPEVRVREKTGIAKAFGKQFIPTTIPVPSQGSLSYLATLNYDPRFVNSITLCFQGGIEGLHLSLAGNLNIKLDKYIIQVASNGKDISALRNNIEQLDKMYEDISIVLMCDGKMIYAGQQQAKPTAEHKPAPATKEEPAPKLGFFARLFGKKSKSPAAPVQQGPQENQAREETLVVTPPVVAPVVASSAPKPVVTSSVPANPVPGRVVITQTPRPVTVLPKTADAPKPQPMPAPQVQLMRLLDLKVGVSQAKQMSEEQIAKMKQLGAAFFQGCQQIMVKKPGNTPELQFEAISRFRAFLESLKYSSHSFADYTRCPETGILSYHAYLRPGGTCYDGGCHSEEPDDLYYYDLRRISCEAYEKEKETCTSFPQGTSTIWHYTADIPEADQTECFIVRRDKLYLKNPMGILGCFEIKKVCR